jgi:hypothetical protein
LIQSIGELSNGIENEGNSMKIRTWAVVVVVIMSAASLANAQQSASESPRPIGAEPEGPTSMVIDNSSLVRAGDSDEPQWEAGDFLFDSMEEGAASFRELNTVLAETGSAKVFYDPEWRDRVGDAGLRFELARDDLSLVYPEEHYEATLVAAIESMEAATIALNSIRNAIDRDAPVFSLAKKELVAQESLFVSALAETRAIHRAEMAAEPAPPINPIAASQIIDALCRGRHAAGSGAYDSCVAEQRAAVDSMTLRSGSSVGLTPQAFNPIRNNCRFELPNDFVQRDHCERRRITAAGGS